MWQFDKIDSFIFTFRRLNYECCWWHDDAEWPPSKLTFPRVRILCDALPSPNKQAARPLNINNSKHLKCKYYRISDTSCTCVAEIINKIFRKQLLSFRYPFEHGDAKLLSQELYIQIYTKTMIWTCMIHIHLWPDLRIYQKRTNIKHSDVKSDTRRYGSLGHLVWISWCRSRSDSIVVCLDC